jgi:aminoglycoside 3-N-acetyltransferase I
MRQTGCDQGRAICYGDVMNRMEIKRLYSGDTAIAVSMFSMMALVFGETPETLSLNYAESLLKRDDFWAVAALEDREPVAGLTAFTLPLTRSETSELLIYDIAVRPEHQRRGIGRALIDTLKKLAVEAGIRTTWVPADNEDPHALEFYRAIGGKQMAATIFTFSE